MIRCIQVGRGTVQGRVIATYPDPSGDFGAIRSMGRVVMGRLIPQERAAEAVPSRSIDDDTFAFLNARCEPRRALYGDEELAEIKAWMAGQ